MIQKSAQKALGNQTSSPWGRLGGDSMLGGDSIDSYIDRHITPEDDYLYRLWRATNIHTIHGRMASGHLQGELLKMLVMMARPKNILEVGTFSGYSAICLARGLKAIDDEARQAGSNAGTKQKGCNAGTERRLYTFEINDEMEDFTRPWIDGSDVAAYIDFRIGDALKEAPKLGVRFDMAFIDGDKRTYCETYDTLFPLMNAGGIILADNTLWDGHVVDHAYDHDQQTVGIRRFNDEVAADKRVDVVILPERDGLTMIRLKGNHNFEF